jgi:hypothetical protein
MKYLAKITDLRRASQPEFIRLDGTGSAASRAVASVEQARSYATYRGKPVADEEGNPLPSVIALSEQDSYLELLAVDNKSLVRGGTLPLTLLGKTYHFKFTEIFL